MNDLRKLTRIILVGLAISGLISGVMALLAVLPHIVFPDGYYGPSAIARFISPLFIAVYSGLIIYFLICKSDLWVEKIVRAEVVTESQSKVFWMPVAFRLVSVFAGILYVYWVVPRMISGIETYFAIKKLDTAVVPASHLDVAQVISWVCLLGLGLYLLCGAPHFVRWQVKKTLEQCKEPEAFAKAGDEEPAGPAES